MPYGQQYGGYRQASATAPKAPQTPAQPWWMKNVQAAQQATSGLQNAWNKAGAWVNQAVSKFNSVNQGAGSSTGANAKTDTTTWQQAQQRWNQANYGPGASTGANAPVDTTTWQQAWKKFRDANVGPGASVGVNNLAPANPNLENYMRQQQQLGQATSTWSMSQTARNAYANRLNAQAADYFSRPEQPLPTPTEQPASSGYGGYGYGGWGGGGGGGGGGYQDIKSWFNNMVQWNINTPKPG